FGRLGRHRHPHRPEVRVRPRREVVAPRGLLVERVEGWEVVGGTEPDLNAGFRRLLDVAAPELVEAGEDLVFGAPSQRKLEDVSWLPGGETFLVGRRAPAGSGELFGQGPAHIRRLVGGNVAQPVDTV